MSVTPPYIIPVSQQSQIVFSAYTTDPAVTVAYKFSPSRVTVRELQVHPLADAHTPENVISALLTKHIGVILRQRKMPLQTRIAYGSVRLQGISRIGIWKLTCPWHYVNMSFEIATGLRLSRRRARHSPGQAPRLKTVISTQ